MKKLFLRGLTALLSFYILLLSAFLPVHTNACFLPVKMSAPVQATAQTSVPLAGDYACILSDGVYFYTVSDGRKGLFTLPKTYYVRLVEYRTDYCKVEYQTDDAAKRLIGYVATDKLTFVEYLPARPYLFYEFDLHYKLDGAEQTDSAFLTEITLSCVYYGDYLIGSEQYCYVLRGDEFGYIPKPSTLSYEENDEYADYVASLQTPSEPTPDAETPTAEQSTPAQIAILVAICLLVPILAALVLKPPHRPPYEDTV